MEEKNKQINKILTNVLKVVGCMIAVGVIIIIVLSVISPSKEKTKDPLDPGLLVTFSKQVVKEYLASPTSAEFPSEDSDYKVLLNESDNTFTVKGSVQSQNAMGVMLKNSYAVKGKYDTEKEQYIEISTDIS